MHPLAPTLTGLSDQELDKKVQELTERYYQALRFSPSIASQIVLLLDSYNSEKQNRALEKSKKAAENGDNSLNDLIKIN
jgi:hypothetical protein